MRVLISDRFWGGIVGAPVAALGGTRSCGCGLPSPVLPRSYEAARARERALGAAPSVFVAPGVSYEYGARQWSGAGSE